MKISRKEQLIQLMNKLQEDLKKLEKEYLQKVVALENRIKKVSDQIKSL